MQPSTLPQYVQDLDQPPKKWYNSTWFWVLLVTSILLVLIGCGVLIFCLTRNDATDNSGSNGTKLKPVGITKDSASNDNIPSPSFGGKKELMAMVTNLKAASKSLVTESTWMDSSSKTELIEKVDNMVANIGYPDWIMNIASLESYYSSMSTSKVNYFESYQNASLFLNAKTFRRLRGRIDREMWNVLPDTYTARYTPRYNAFTITSGYLQFPFFKKDRLAALNYGAIGSTIGHEITHSFEDQRDWESTTSNNHRGRAQCFVDQYSSYTSPKGTFLNGEKTRDENIADDVGVRQAFRAYKYHVEANGIEPKLPGLEKFTSDQLFFLSYANQYCGNKDPESLEYYIKADTHSLDKFRAIGPLSNNDDFVNQFKCPAGSPMNRVNKCAIW